MITPGMNRQQRRAVARQKHSFSSAPSSNLANLVSNPVWKALKTLDVGHIELEWIPREQNSHADALAATR